MPSERLGEMFKVDQKSLGSETSDMNSEGLGKMFEGDFAGTCTAKLLKQV